MSNAPCFEMAASCFSMATTQVHLPSLGAAASSFMKAPSSRVAMMAMPGNASSALVCFEISCRTIPFSKRRLLRITALAQEAPLAAKAIEAEEQVSNFSDVSEELLEAPEEAIQEQEQQPEEQSEQESEVEEQDTYDRDSQAIADGTELHVGNLSSTSDSAGLAEIFQERGNVEMVEIQGGRDPNWPFEEKFRLSTKASPILEAKTKWTDLDLDIHRWIRSSRVVQWYPGHIAKAERELKQQLKLMDVVVEVRDARIPMATGHPEMDSWIGERKKILVLNREDMISTADKNAWAAYFSRKGITVIFANGRLGMGTMKLARVAKSLADNVNTKRRAKGLLPRAVRAGVVGYPNVGKSSLINRLLKRKVCATAPRPGVTRELKWIRIGKDLDLLDSPGILPLRLNDQAAATKLAICDDIGERSYAVAGVATILIEMLKQIPTAGASVLHERYKIDADGCSGEIFLKALGHRLFNGDVNQAAFRILQDFRKGKFGWIALERPSSSR